MARRFLLWSAALSCGGVTNRIDAMTKMFVARALDYPLLSLTNSMTGLFAALCLTFAFWPYRPAVADNRSPAIP